MTPTAFLYGHYACPYTYIAGERLRVLSSEAPLHIVWRPLAPPRPGTGPDGWSALAGDDEPLSELLLGLQRDAASVGLALTLPAARPDPSLAHIAAEFARDCGREAFERLHGALFRAVFVDGTDIESAESLVALGEGAGLDAEGLSAALTDGRYDEALGEIEGEALKYGIDATPTVLLGRFKLVGAAPLDVLRATRERAASEAGEAETP